MTYITQLTERTGRLVLQIIAMSFVCATLLLLQSTTIQAQWTTNGNNINNTNTGNVGIGTSNPASSLHVATESAASPRGITDSQHSADGNGGLFVFRKSRGTIAAPAGTVNGDFIGSVYSEAYDGASYISGGRIRFGIDGTVSSGVVPTTIQFLTGSNGAGTERMRVTSTGNVGIGTSTPSSKLVVTGGADTALAIGDRTTSGSIGLQFWGTGYKHAGVRFDGDNVIVENASGSGVPSTWYSSGTPMNFIVRNGSVGIGTISPGYKLDVQGGSLNSSGGLCMAGDCKTAWSQVGGSQWTTSGSNIYYNSGNVGVGTTTPGGKFAVTANTGASSSTLTITPDGTNNYYAGNIHDALLLDGSLTQPHGVYGGGNVRLFRIKALTGADSMVIGRGGDIVVTPNTNYAGSALKLSPDGTNSYYAGLDYDVLQIVGTGLTTHGTYTGKVARLIHVTNVSGGDAFVIARDGNATFGGNVTVTGSLNAKYQDVAEWVESSQALVAGTVVVLDQTKSNQVIASSQAYDTRVAGVISSQPGLTLGVDGAGKVLVATTGRVRMKVDASAGAIQVGDLLVTSDKAGFAKRSEPLNLGGVQIHRPGTLIGKALEPLAQGTGEILVLLSLQ